MKEAFYKGHNLIKTHGIGTYNPPSFPCCASPPPSCIAWALVPHPIPGFHPYLSHSLKLAPSAAGLPTHCRRFLHFKPESPDVLLRLL